MPTLQQLRYLVAVADTLSFSRAAAICSVAQPTLSMQIKELENRLQARLIERTRARVVVTTIGEEVARRARAMLADLDDIREIARCNDPAAPPTLLQIGVMQTVGAYVLSLGVPPLRQQYPDMRIQIREEREDILLRQLGDGVHDVILLAEEIEHSNFECRLLMTEPLMAVLPADHRLAQRAVIAPDDLAGETIMTMECSPRLRAQIMGLCAQVGARHDRDYEGTTLDTLRQMIAIGMGVSLLPALYVRSEVVREQSVVACPLSCEAPVRNISLFWRKDSPRTATYEAVAENLRENLQPWHHSQVRTASREMR